MKWLIVLALVAVGTGEARAELWMSTLGELMKDATRVEVIDVDAMDTNTGVAQGTVFEAWKSKRATGERVTEPLGTLAGLVKQGDRVLVICDRGECPRAIGVEHDGWYTLAAQEPMDGAFVVPNVVSHLALPALVGGKPTPSLCVRGTIALLDEPRGAGVPFDALTSATTGSGGAAVGANASGKTGPLKRGTQATIGAMTFGERWAPGLVVQLGDAMVASRDANAHPDCRTGTYVPKQPGPRTQKELAVAVAGKLPASVFARGTYRGKSLELAIDGEQIAVVGVGPPDSTSMVGASTTFGYPGKLTIDWPVSGSVTVVEALAKAKSMVVKVGTTNVTLTYVPAK